MVETRLIRPGRRLVEACCPGCRHVRKMYDNASRGVAHCMYCGADFEWTENGILADLPARLEIAGRIPELADIAFSTR